MTDTHSTTTETPVTTPTKAKRVRKAAAPKSASKRKPSNIARTADNPAKSIVPMKFKEKYADHDGTNGTALALALKDETTMKNKDGRDCLDVDTLFAIAKAHGIDTAKYKGLNNGQLRMNVGNRLRGKLQAGEKITIGKRVFADAKKALAVKPVKAEPAQAAA